MKHRSNPPNALDRVFLIAHAQYRKPLLHLANLLKQTYGSEVHFYCGSQDQLAYYKSRPAYGAFASLTVCDHLYRAARTPVEDRDQVLETAAENEAYTGVTYNELAVSDRHFGRGYSLGGFHHPRSRMSEETSYLQMVQGFNAEIAFWRSEIEAKKPTVIVNASKVAAVVARVHDIPTRLISASRFQNLHYWGTNEFRENPEFEAVFRSITDGAGIELDVPYAGHMSNRTILIKQGRTGYALRKIGLHILRRVYGRIRGLQQSKNYYLRDEVRYLWRIRQDTRRLQRCGLALSELKGQRFVFFPLHTEPETALQMLSPEHFYQLSAIAAISRDLPVGVKLAVKEALFAIGRRPTDFYDQISELKNVVWLEPLEFGLDITRAADALVTITGTAGFEAAVMGKPVISFGRHNIYNFLPHVSVVTDEADLKPRLCQALDGSFDGDEAARIGARFLEAIRQASFDMGEYDFVNPEADEGTSAPALLDGLARSLKVEPAPAPR